MIDQIVLLLQGAGTTVFIALCGLVVGMCGGIVGGLLSCQQLRLTFITRCIRTYVFVVQGTPLYVQILLIYFVLPDLWGGSLSPFTAGIVAVGMNSIAYVTQIIRGGVNALPRGQWEAAMVLGYSLPGTIRHIIVPQVLRATLPSLVNEAISLVKESSILGVIGVLELTKVSRDMVSRTLEPFAWYGGAALMYLCITMILSLIAYQLEKGLAHD